MSAPRRFVLCPRCEAKSKVLYSMFGGLQTRRCRNGHEFTYDKWIADRLIWAPGASPYGRTVDDGLHERVRAQEGEA
jgi:hypothetical protein